MKKLDFLGACHTPNSVRGYEVTDRKEVWIGDYCYAYSIDSDCELIAQNVNEIHYKNKASLKQLNEIRSQLGLSALVKLKK